MSTNISDDKMTAQRMLADKNEGYTFGKFIRKNARRYLLIVAFDAALICMVGWMRNYIALTLLIGLSIGSMAQDFVWFRTLQNNWSFTVKTTDWQKVEELAKGEKPA